MHLVVCTDGGKGTTDPAVEPAELAAERAAELEASSALDRSAQRREPGLPRRRADRLDGLPGHAGRRVRALRPDVVCGHDPTAVFFGQDYFNHRDHRIAGAGPARRRGAGGGAAPLLPRGGPGAPGPDRAPVGHARARRVGRRLRHHRDQGGSRGVPPQPVRRRRTAGPATPCAGGPPRRAGGPAWPTPRGSAG